MTYRCVSQSWDSDKFLKFLITKHNISDRVARNYLSRCRRLEATLNIDLVSETSSTDAYINLAEKIASYAENYYATAAEVMVCTGTLRLAAKKFAMFAHGCKVKLPRVYGKINLVK